LNTFPNRQPLAAGSDPVSSHLAGATITESGSRNNQKAALLAWLRGAREPLTSAEIAAAGGFDRHGVGRRLPDLEQDGLVERCGKRTCRQTRAVDCITWQIADGDSMATRNRVRAEATPLQRGRSEQLTATAAAESVSEEQLGPTPATCARCKGAGRILIRGTEPTVWVFCDEARGKTCKAAERRRRINPDPNQAGSELSA